MSGWVGTTLTSDTGPLCYACGYELTEYLGFGLKPGEGDWFCKRCENSGVVRELVDPDEDITPPMFIIDWDFTFVQKYLMAAGRTNLATGEVDIYLELQGIHAMQCADTIEYHEGEKNFITAFTVETSPDRGPITKIQARSVL